MQEEEWALGPAVAKVLRVGDCTLVELRGVVTAQAYEALHVRLSRESARDVRLLVGGGAMLVATARSLAEAASRGTRAGDAAKCITFAVLPARHAWATCHLAACQHEGLSRRVDLLGQAMMAPART
jgi:hypothetical protein